MTDDNGHEPRPPDEDHIKQALDEGGALLTVQVEIGGQFFWCKKIVTGVDLAEVISITKTEMIWSHLRSMAETINVETIPGRRVIR